MTKKGFRLVLPPYMLKYEVLSEVLDMETFKDMVYKIENEDLYLIGTAEHPIAAYLRRTELLEDQLPLLFVGVSPSFRREASAGNRDMKGIFRVHQFHKVEQFVFSLPEESWKWHEELIRNAEELWQGLGLPYRVVLLCAMTWVGAPPSSMTLRFGCRPRECIGKWSHAVTALTGSRLSSVSGFLGRI